MDRCCLRSEGDSVLSIDARDHLRSLLLTLRDNTEHCDHKKDDYDDCVEEREWKEKESGKRKRVGVRVGRKCYCVCILKAAA